MDRELNKPIKITYNKDCQVCGETIDAFTQVMCEDCMEALKELILEKKEYIKKHKKK